LIAADSKYLVADVKHGKNSERLHHLGIATFSEELRKAVILSRTRVSKLDSVTYQLAFEYFFNTLGDDGVDVMEYIKSLEAVLVDYSAAQAQGFKNYIKIIFGQEEGLKQAERLLKGCSVHWLRSCQRVTNLCVDPLIQPNFMRLCIAIRNMENLNDVLETFSKIEEIYSDLKPWIDWWTSDDNLKPLCRSFSSNNHWVSTPNDTNIVESMNNVLDRVSSQNASVQFISEFHLDGSVVEDIQAASKCVRLSYRDRCNDAREKQNKTRKTKRYRQRSLVEVLD
jgi:hypothetical protein